MIFDQRRIMLPMGITLNVATAGKADSPPVILLHGFPESHRTWRGVAPRLAERFRLVMPDLRGFGASDKPQPVGAYQTDSVIRDVLQMADALEIGDFALVGHDWGGALAWALALRHQKRVRKLGIVNAPHPVIFQRSLIRDEKQRAASQYINLFRAPGIADVIRARGFDWFFDRSFGAHVDLGIISAEERRRYIADWSRPGAIDAMLNWYRASAIDVPAPGAKTIEPAWLAQVPKLGVPTLVVWGMRDPALLPIQLDGLDRRVEKLSVKRLPDAGHFAPWEAPDDVAEALMAFL